METITTTEPVEFDKKTWKTDPNAYARNYYKEKGNILILCECGKHIKKLVISKHLKSKNHKLFLLEAELAKLKDNKVVLLELEIQKLKDRKV